MGGNKFQIGQVLGNEVLKPGKIHSKSKCYDLDNKLLKSGLSRSYITFIYTVQPVLEF